MFVVAGTPWSTGATLSSTVIVREHSAVFPQASVARYVRTITSGLPAQPDPPLFVFDTSVTAGTPQSSDATTPEVFAGGTAFVQVSTRSAGQLMVGGAESTAVMRCVAVTVTPQASVACQTRTTTRGQPALVVCVSVTAGFAAPPQVAEALTIFVAGGIDPHGTVSSGGTPLNVGHSETVTSCVAPTVLPTVSTADQMRV